MLPSLIQLLHLSDKDILSDACWAVSYLTDGDNDRIDVVVKTGVVPRLVELMSHEGLSVMVCSWIKLAKCFQNTITFFFFFLGPVCLAFYFFIFCPPQTPALRSIGNIVSGSDLQTQAVIDAGVLNVLPQLMRHPKASVQKEAVWALSNVAAGPCKQIQQLITCGLLPPLVDRLKNVSR